MLLLRTAYGQVDVYHFYGTHSDGFVDARHSSGHHVHVDLVSPDAIEGSITLGSGRTMNFEGKRRTGVRLAAEDCAPPGWKK